jgi:hypothetical protein
LQLLPTTCPNPVGPAGWLVGCGLTAGLLAAVAVALGALTGFEAVWELSVAALSALAVVGVLAAGGV